MRFFLRFFSKALIDQLSPFPHPLLLLSPPSAFSFLATFSPSLHYPVPLEFAPPVVRFPASPPLKKNHSLSFLPFLSFRCPLPICECPQSLLTMILKLMWSRLQVLRLYSSYFGPFPRTLRRHQPFFKDCSSFHSRYPCRLSRSQIPLHRIYPR